MDRGGGAAIQAGKRMRYITNGEVNIAVDDEDKAALDDAMPETLDTSIETMRETPITVESYLESIDQ